MKNVVSVSNAREGLSRMLKGIQKNPETVYKIAVRNETIAELRSAQTMIRSGEAVRKLIHLRQKLSHSIKDKTRESISKRVKDSLYPEVNQ